MKIPSEAELIELENALSHTLATDYHGGIGRTLRTLIALARDPSQLLRDIPDDDDLDRALREYTLSDAEVKQLQELNSMPLDEVLERISEPPRKAERKPVLIVAPKPQLEVTRITVQPKPKGKARHKIKVTRSLPRSRK